MSFTVSSDNPALFAGGGQPAVSADGTLTYTPAPNANGVATVTVRAADDGGTATGGGDTSAPQTFAIAVTAVNDAPASRPAPPRRRSRTPAAQTVAGWATAITPGPADEPAQVVVVHGLAVTTRRSSRAAVSRPSRRRHAHLHARDRRARHGNVSVRAVDDGGTAGGGADTSAPQSFTITIVNLPPVANADTPTVLENDVAGVTFDVLANDTDPESDPLTVAAYDASTIALGGPDKQRRRQLHLRPCRALLRHRYVHLHRQRRRGNTATDVVTITITPVPDPPATADDAFLTPQDTPLCRPAPGLLANDADRAGTLDRRPVPVAAPANGILSLAADGSFTYTPLAGFTGTDTFTYRATSSTTGLSSDAVATITISATSSTSLLYLRDTGPTSELWNMTTTAPALAARARLRLRPPPGPDHQIERRPDLGDASKSQTWRFPFAGALALNGPVDAPSLQQRQRARTYAYLYDCTAGGAAPRSPTAPSPNNWIGLGLGSQHDVTVGSVNRTLPAGHELRIGLYVTSGDEWVAMTSSFPSSLEPSVP